MGLNSSSQCLMGDHEGAELFTAAHGRRMTHNGCEFKEEKFSLDISKDLLHEDSQVLGQATQRD